MSRRRQSSQLPAGPAVDVVVHLGGWEHSCCGDAVERDQLVEWGCLRTTGDDGASGTGGLRLTRTHHHLEPEVDVRGRVVDLLVVRASGEPEPVHRVPSGRALRGFDPDDDGHLEQLWTGVDLPSGEEFFVVVRSPVRPAPSPQVK
ncbi:hypothetical protein [Quadrisphaera sp. INWT6]|uniref:hypothetical protein n=1 Tax=Quadrisphaera sp. INWT6 TaxID=2596917 RepID=UPI0019D5E7B8|nr:hypothetical protein [Quadrisphaera sp. INWT6]